MELHRVGRRGLPHAETHVGARRGPGWKVNQRLRLEVEGEGIYLQIDTPHTKKHGLHSNRSSKSASGTAGISREEGSMFMVVWGGGSAMEPGGHGSPTLTSGYPQVGYLAPPNIRSPSAETAGASFFWVPIQSPEVFGVGLF